MKGFCVNSLRTVVFFLSDMWGGRLVYEIYCFALSGGYSCDASSQVHGAAGVDLTKIVPHN